MVMVSTSCAWLKALRQELEEDGISETAEIDYSNPLNRFLPPPPTSVVDNRISAIAGTPLDFSGMRAKSGRITKDDFLIAAAKNENSLWTDDGQTNYFFARNRFKMPGDLVTVFIEDGLRQDMVNEVKKLLPEDFRDQQIRVPGLTKENKAAGNDPNRSVAADSQAQGQSPSAEGAASGTTGALNLNEIDPNDLLTGEVIERYPNGNLRIRALKRIPFRRQVRNIEVTAIVRNADVNEQDIIKSSKFFEHRVEIYR